MLFNFRLAPLEQIRPWGESGLHWFGLTDGEYWMQVGDATLFEYSDAVRGRYCDYYVVRLYEDLIMEILPHILEPVPKRMQAYLSLDLSTWGRTQNLRDDAVFERWMAATGWIGHRTLDTGYLRPSTQIRFWSDTENVHIEWDNRRALADGKPVWTAQHGAAVLSRAEFMREIQSFHDNLMRQMSERVARVVASAGLQAVPVDTSGLMSDHATRCGELDRTLARPFAPTDWERACEALNEIAQENRT